MKSNSYTDNTIHIGIDGNEANVTNRVGSNRYAFGILWGLHSLATDTVSYTIYLKHPPLTDMPPQHHKWRYQVIPSKFAWTQWRLPLALYLSLNRPDVFFSPGHYAPRVAPMPTVVTIMDLAFLAMPQLFLRYKRGVAQLAKWTRYSVKHAKAVIAISQATKKDIINQYQLPESVITVAYPGIDLTEYQPASVRAINQLKRRYQIQGNYILHLGTLQPRKNLKRLITAFETLPEKYHQVKLVLAGQAGWMTQDILTAITSSSKAQQIIRTGYIPPDDIPTLLSGAACVAMVGLYEGFGMPAAEALACGTVPVVSNTTSLPEVVGKAGIIVDPWSVTSIRHGLKSALEETATKKQYRLRLGKKQLQAFNWQQSAKIIQDTLIQLIQNKKPTINTDKQPS